ncbi:hypothetical protein [Methanobrevibacter sp.]|uniref:hypothetical protein n=1 Tax=Methanobrevibacter sp. TaxID=66852 RepID=UPI0026087AA7|nr:hypothetical protein [uncultured Methanobrevibacter sp.]
MEEYLKNRVEKKRDGVKKLSSKILSDYQVDGLEDIFKYAKKVSIELAKKAVNYYNTIKSLPSKAGNYLNDLGNKFNDNVLKPTENFLKKGYSTLKKYLPFLP